MRLIWCKESQNCDTGDLRKPEFVKKNIEFVMSEYRADDEALKEIEDFDDNKKLRHGFDIMAVIDRRMTTKLFTKAFYFVLQTRAELFYGKGKRVSYIQV